MEKRPRLRFLAGREDAGSTPDPAAPTLFYKEHKKLIFLMMKNNYFLECEHCKNLIYGFKFGLRYLFGNISNIISTQRVSDKKIIFNFYDDVHTFYSKGYSIYQCAKCNSYENIYHLLLYDIKGECIFETRSFCENCNLLRDYISVELDEKSFIDFKCLKCNKASHIIKKNKS